MQWLNVDMPNAKKSEIVRFCLLPRGDVILKFCELFQSRFSRSFNVENITPR